MKKRIDEIRDCLNKKLYEAALALALTLPDICGQVEYPKCNLVGQRYTKWIDECVDMEVFYEATFDEFGDFHPLTAQDIYRLRCSFLHSGDQDIKNKNIDRFSLVRPGSLGTSRKGTPYGYKYVTELQTDNSVKHIACIDIEYLSKALCDSAEEYYKSKDPDDFIDHTFTLELG